MGTTRSSGDQTAVTLARCASYASTFNWDWAAHNLLSRDGYHRFMHDLRETIATYNAERQRLSHLLSDAAFELRRHKPETEQQRLNVEDNIALYRAQVLYNFEAAMIFCKIYNEEGLT